MTRGWPLALVLLSMPARAGDAIEAFGLRWQTPVRADWKYEGGVLHLLTPRPSTEPRRPSQYALAATPEYIKVQIEAEVMPEPKQVRNRRNSLILVYAWRDQDHFNYAHLSVDSARQAAHHNGIFHVYGGDRVRISSEEGPHTLTDGAWHKVRLVYDGTTGRVDIWVNGQTSPSMRAVDMSLGAGKIGIGSFFDMGSFRNVRITGEAAR
ncbi:MAG: hypothetical protein HY235_14865 [Acidobacteria bacterium]|nr:hypothetical protein [Acidobacteriota bacterium]